MWAHIHLPRDRPEATAEGSDPVGPENNEEMVNMARCSDIVVFAYGQPCHRTLGIRGPELARLLIAGAGIVPHLLRLAKNSTPWHPLYLRSS